MHRACVAFRVKLRRDTGTDLAAADCELLLGVAFTCEGGEEVTLQINPGRFYECLGQAIARHAIALGLPDYEKVAWWCYREAAGVHTHPGGMRRLAGCLFIGQGVTPDPVQAVAWYQKAADMGDVASKARLGGFLVEGEARAGVAKDAAPGFVLLREAVDQGHGMALYHVAECYLTGEGVGKDAERGVSLLRQVINNQEDAIKA